MSEECKFELGAVVRLKSGGQAMTVEAITATVQDVPGTKDKVTIHNIKCVWMPDRPEHGPWKREIFPDHVLTLAEASGETLATMKAAAGHDGGRS